MTFYKGINASGKIITESREEAPCTGIELGIPANVYISKGLQQEVKITARRGVLKQILTSVSDDILYLEYDTCIKNLDSITIYITMQKIDLLEINGSGSISTVDSIKTEVIDLIINGSGSIKANIKAINIEGMINGSGDITLSGTSGSFDIKINGSGDMYAFNAPTGNCTIKVNGSGDCEVYANNSLDIKINGSGDVDYKGFPLISISLNGSGRINRLK